MHPSDLKSLRLLLEAIREDFTSFREVFKHSRAAITGQQIAQEQSSQKHWEETNKVLAGLRPKPEDKAADESKLQRRHRENLGIQGILALGTWLAFAAAAIYAWEAHRTLKEIEKQTKSAEDSASAAQSASETARQSLESVQRAFMLFKGNKWDVAVFHTNGISQDRADFTESWENVGATSANVYAFIYDIHKMPMEPSREQFHNGVASKPQVVSRTIGPHDEFAVGPILTPYSLIFGAERGSAPSVATTTIQTASSTPRVFFWGWVVYKDVFDRTPVRLTEFCRYIDATGMDRSTNPPKEYIHFGYCGEHNCADDQCTDHEQLVQFVKKRIPDGTHF